MMLAKLTSLLMVSAGYASATKIYMFNNSREVPGTPSLIEFDHATDKYSVVSTLNDAQDSNVDAAVICNRTWYSVWDDVPIADGITAIDLDTGKFKVYSNGGLPGGIFHALGCGADPGVLLALVSVPHSSGGLDFSLVKYELENENVTTVGKFDNDAKFPTNFVGFDNGFHFSADGKYLYATFPDNEYEPKVRGGSLHIMNIATGNVEERLSFPDGSGMPYGLYPSGGSNNKFKGVFLNLQKKNVYLCDVEKSEAKEDDSLSVENCLASPWLLSGSRPSPVCSDGLLYSLQDNMGRGPGSTQELTGTNLGTGIKSFQTDLSTVVPFNYLGASAC